jgi:hypothetical protein
MTATLTPIPPRVIELRADNERLQAELDSLPTCGHFPLGAHRQTCRRCACHWEADCNDRVIERLEQRGEAS